MRGINGKNPLKIDRNVSPDVFECLSIRWQGPADFRDMFIT